MAHLAHVLVGQSKDATTALYILQVLLIIVRRQVFHVIFEYLRSALAEQSQRDIASVFGDLGQHRHSLERRIERKLLDLNNFCVLWPVGLSLAQRILSELNPLKALLLNWVAHDGTISACQSVGATEDDRRVFIPAEDGGHFMEFSHLFLVSADSRDALNHQVVLGERARLIEAADVDLAC